MKGCDYQQNKPNNWRTEEIQPRLNIPNPIWRRHTRQGQTLLVAVKARPRKRTLSSKTRPCPRVRAIKWSSFLMDPPNCELNNIQLKFKLIPTIILFQLSNDTKA